MPYFKDTQNNLHFLDDVQYIYLLPEGSLEITDEEAEAIRLSAITELTLEQQAESVRQALQSTIDDKAKSLGFSGGNALMLYVGFANPFQDISSVFATWEATVWVEAEAYKAEVNAGNKPMLSPDEAVALMPVYPA